jgi:hypothetical protein
MQKESAKKKKSKKNMQKEEPHSGRRKPGRCFTSIAKKGRKEMTERKEKQGNESTQNRTHNLCAPGTECM